MHVYPKRVCLEGLEIEIFKLVAYSATPEQWQEWLRVPLEHAAARGNLDLFNKLLGAGANGRAGWRGCRGRTLLDAAAVGGNEGIVSGLLRVGAQPDVNVVPCSSKRSALYTATVLGHAAVARRLIVAGADVNVVDPVGSCILNEIIWGGHEKLVTDLLIAGADPNWRGGRIGAFPLHWAAAEGYDGIVSTLLLRGADKDALDQEGFSPLIVASIRGNLSVVKTLLAAGADTSIRENFAGDSALHYAVREGHGGVVDAIIEHGADVNAVFSSALIEAIWDGHEQLVTDLLIAGADPSWRDGRDGASPLHWAAAEGFDGIVSTLLLRGADKDILDNSGKTALIWASRRGNLSVVKTLLAAGADGSVQDTWQNRARDYAVVIGHGGVVDAIIEYGADVNAVDQYQETPLHGAAWWSASVIDVLVDAGANIEARASHGFTPLHKASETLNRASILGLLRHGAAVNAQDDSFRTPLFIAAELAGYDEGAAEIIDALLRAGTDETIADCNGNKPADVVDVGTDEAHYLARHVDRVRQLLAKAPTDRACRRRGWLVMLCSHDSKAEAGQHRSDGHGAGGEGEGGASAVVKSKGVAGAEYGRPRKQTTVVQMVK